MLHPSELEGYNAAQARLRAERADTMEVVHEMEILLLGVGPKSVQAEILFFTLPQRLIGSGREAFVSVFSPGVRPLAAALYERLGGTN